MKRPTLNWLVCTTLFFQVAHPTNAAAQPVFDSSLISPYAPAFPDPNRPEYSCEANYSWINTPPFMITDTYVNSGKFPVSASEYEKNWDNFRLEEDSLSIIGYLPQRSIVRVLDPNFDQIQADKSPDRERFIAVEVLSIPKNQTEAVDDNVPKILRDILSPNNERIKPGQRGRVHEDVLQHASGFTYLTRNNTFLRHIPGLDDIDVNLVKAVEPVSRSLHDTVQYEARVCCLNKDVGRCIYKYRFRILDNDLKEMDVAEVDIEDCDMLSGVRPVDKDQALAILRVVEATQASTSSAGVDDVDYIDSMGLIKFPFTFNLVEGDEMIEGPYNTSHYRPDGATLEERRALSDTFINATTGCALTQVLKKWNQLHPKNEYEIQLGNMWHPQAWGIHETHEIRNDHGGAQGTCFDIRPPNKNGRREAHNVSNFDLQKTRAFASLLRAAGADTILFNNSRVKERTGSGGREHNDHLHICFNPMSKTVRNTCRDGL